MTVWVVTSTAFDEGGLVLQGIFSTEELAREYAFSLVFDTQVNPHEVDAPGIHNDLSHYKSGEAPSWLRKEVVL